MGLGHLNCEKIPHVGMQYSFLKQLYSCLLHICHIEIISFSVFYEEILQLETENVMLA